MNKLFRVSACTCFLLAVLAPAAMGENETRIDVHAFSGGGGSSSGAGILLTGTIGQAIGGTIGGGDYEIRSGFHAATLEVLLPEPGESFQAWMDGLSVEDLPPENQRGPMDAPAGDGMSNLLKYALGLMPMIPSADAAPRVIVASALDHLGVERDYLGIELWRSANAAVEFELESSEGLGNWAPAWFSNDVLQSAGDDGRERVQLLTGILVEDHPKYFLRLRMTMQ